MAVKKKNRIHIGVSFDQLDPTPDYVVGFIPILPERKRLTPDLNEIVRANEDSSRPAENCWIPLEQEYREHRNEISEALRDLLGYFRPFHAKDLVLVMELVLPAGGRHRSKYFVQDSAQTLLDAAKWTHYTDDEKRLGLIDDCAAFYDMHLSRRTATDGEPTGTWFEIVPERNFGEEMFCDARMTTGEMEHQTLVDWAVARACGLPSRTIGANVPTDDPSRAEGTQETGRDGISGEGAERPVELDMALLADDDTPLAVDIGRYYVALRSAYSREKAARLAAFEQSALAMALASRSDVRPRLEVVRAKTASLGIPDGRLDLVDRRLSMAEIDGIAWTGEE